MRDYQQQQQVNRQSLEVPRYPQQQSTSVTLRTTPFEQSTNQNNSDRNIPSNVSLEHPQILLLPPPPHSISPR